MKVYLLINSWIIFLKNTIKKLILFKKMKQTEPFLRQSAKKARFRFGSFQKMSGPSYQPIIRL